MKQAFDKFLQIMDDTKSLASTYDYMCNVLKPPYDYSDLLRWQWAQTVSALDNLIHDLVRIGMVDIYKGTRLPTPKYESFSISLAVLSEMKSNQDQEILIFEKHVILANGYKSFQDPKKIAEALSFIWNENQKWERIAHYVNGNTNSTKIFLKNIVIRRNQIVHQGDYDGYSLHRQDIDVSDTADVLSFIEKLGEAIFLCVK